MEEVAMSQKEICLKGLLTLLLIYIYIISVSSIDLPLFNHLIELMTSSDNWSRDSNGGL